MVSLIPAVAFTMAVLAATHVTSLIDGEAGAATGLLFMFYGLSMVRVCPCVCESRIELERACDSLRDLESLRGF